jgi:hypothetical protein
MKTIRKTLGHRLSSEAFDGRVGQLACDLGTAAFVPTAVVALVRHPGGRADLVFGLVLVCLVGLLLVALGRVCRRVVELSDRIRLQSRWPEFASYGICVGLLVVGIRELAALELTQAQVTLGVLLSCALSLAVLVLGVTTTLVRFHER